jgi:transcriptional regulator with XRE-family HTH domain
MILKSNNLAKLIKSRRIELNLSQAQVHNYMGWKELHTQYLSNIELGKCQLPPKHINKISMTLHLSREALIENMVQDYKEALEKQIGQ